MCTIQLDMKNRLKKIVMPRTYQLRRGEAGGKEYKPKKRERKKKGEIPSSQEVRSIIEESVIESTQRSSQCAASLPGIISSQEMVPAESSGATGDTLIEEEVSQSESQSQSLIDLTEEYHNQTVASKRERTRSFMITINKGSKEILNLLKREGIESEFIIIGGVENAPTTGHEHLHAVIYYKNQHSVDRLQKKIKGYGQVLPIINYTTGKADYESLIKCVRYIQKQFKVIYQNGKLPDQGKRVDLETALDECKTLEEFMMNHRSLYLRYCNGITHYYERATSYQQFKSVYEDVKNGTIHKKNVKIIFITGFSSTGKSSFGWQIAVNYLKIPIEQLGTIKYTSNGTFNNGVNINAPYLIWNEFRDSQLSHDEFYQLCDKFGTSCNIKYGKTYLRPKMIIIDSIQALEKIYPEEVDRDRYQIYRRIFKYLEMDEDYNVREIDLKPLLEKTKGKPMDEESIKRREEFEQLQKTRSYKPFDPKSLLDDFVAQQDTIHKLPNSMSLDKIDDDTANAIFTAIEQENEKQQ